MSNELAPIENNKIIDVVDVDHALEEWRAYQRLTRELLDETDYQTHKGKKFKTKSAWQKYARAFNINTQIIDKEIVKNDKGFVIEAEYTVRATLPNGRFVESDGSCDRRESGKRDMSNHSIKATAKTRATNRAISELIGAGDVSADELDMGFEPKSSNHEIIETEATPADFVTAQELKENEPVSDTVETVDGDEDLDKVYRTAGDVLTYATRLSKDNTSGNILKNINKLHAPLDLKQNAREQLIQNSIMIQKYDNKLTCAQIFSILKERIAIDKLEPKPSVAMKILGGYNRSGLCDDATCRKVANYLLGLKLNDEGEFL